MLDVSRCRSNACHMRTLARGSLLLPLAFLRFFFFFFLARGKGMAGTTAGTPLSLPFEDAVS